MAAPMREFVEGSAVIVGCGFEGIGPGKVDRVFGSTVEGAVLLVMSNLSAGVMQNRLARFRNFPLLPVLRYVIRNPVDLLGVEHGVDPADRAGVFTAAWVR